MLHNNLHRSQSNRLYYVDEYNNKNTNYTNIPAYNALDHIRYQIGIFLLLWPFISFLGI